MNGTQVIVPFARVTKTGKYDPEIEDDEEDDSW